MASEDKAVLCRDAGLDAKFVMKFGLKQRQHIRWGRRIIGYGEAKCRTYKGRVAASRASLSLLLVLPVDDRRRCLGPKLVPDTTVTKIGKYFAPQHPTSSYHAMVGQLCPQTLIRILAKHSQQQQRGKVDSGLSDHSGSI